MDELRKAILDSQATVKLIEGKPGVGKTWFGCELAYHALTHPPFGVHSHQKILFLTFARNAAARIRQVFMGQRPMNRIGKNNLLERIRIDTFCGFFWWLVESYGRYAAGATTKRLWLVGSRELADAPIPGGYEGYTFDKVEARALELLTIEAIGKLISEVYPLIIVDEFQDVHDRLFEIGAVMGRTSRLVLLRGPGQCIYRSLPRKAFNPDHIRQRCIDQLHAVPFELPALCDDKQRYCPAIKALISQFDDGGITLNGGSGVWFEAVRRKNTKGNPNQLETFAASALSNMKKWLGFSNHSFAVLASTNQAVAKLGKRLRDGSRTYQLAPQPHSLLFGDNVFLQYGRLMLHLLKTHWIAAKPEEICQGSGKPSQSDRVQNQPL
jgi:hypothetical protein